MRAQRRRRGRLFPKPALARPARAAIALTGAAWRSNHAAVRKNHAASPSNHGGAVKPRGIAVKPARRRRQTTRRRGRQWIRGQLLRSEP